MLSKNINMILPSERRSLVKAIDIG